MLKSVPLQAAALATGVLAIAIAACSSPPSPGPAPHAPRAPCVVATAADQAAARALVEAGRFARGLGAMDAIIGVCPEAGAALAGPRARALAELGQCAAARKIDLPRNEADAVAATCAERTAGLEHPERVRAASELSAAAWPLLADGRWDEARTAFDAALAKAPVASALVGAARVAAHAGDAAGARRLFDRAHAELAAEGGRPQPLLLPHLLIHDRRVLDAGLHVGLHGTRLFVSDPARPERLHTPVTKGLLRTVTEGPTGLLVLDEAGLSVFALRPFRLRGSFAFEGGRSGYLETSRDGTRVLVAGEARSVVVDLTDPAAPKEVFSFEGRTPVLSGDGRLAGYVDATGVRVQKVDAPFDLVTSVPNAGAVRMSADGRLLSVCLSTSLEWKGPLAMIEIASGKELWRTRQGLCWGARMDNFVPPEGFSAGDRLITSFGSTFDAQTGQPAALPDRPAPPQPPSDWLAEVAKVRQPKSEYTMSGDGAFAILKGVDASPAFRLAPLSFTMDVPGFTGVRDTHGSTVAAGPNPVHVVDLALAQVKAVVTHERCAYPRATRLFSADGTRLVCVETSNTFEAIVDIADEKADLRFKKELRADPVGMKGDEILLRRGLALEWYNPRTDQARPVDLPPGTLASVSPRLTYAAVKSGSGLVLRPLAGGADIRLAEDVPIEGKPVWSEDDARIAVGSPKRALVFALPDPGLAGEPQAVKPLGELPAVPFALGPRATTLAAFQADGLLRFHFLDRPPRALFWARGHDAVLVEEAPPASPRTRSLRVQIAGSPSPLLFCDYGGTIVAFDVCRDVLEDPHLSEEIFGVK